MSQRVFVKRVIVEYAADGKRFSLEFDKTPRAIVFNVGDLMLADVGLKAPPLPFFDPTTPLQDQALSHEPGASSEVLQAGEDISALGEDLWWLTPDGWFHPQT